MALLEAPHSCLAKLRTDGNSEAIERPKSAVPAQIATGFVRRADISTSAAVTPTASSWIIVFAENCADNGIARTRPTVKKVPNAAATSTASWAEKPTVTTYADAKFWYVDWA